MLYEYTMPNRIKELLEKADCLGFDTTEEAMQAIFTHRDWETRWDLRWQYMDGIPCARLLYDAEIKEIRDFKQSHLPAIRALLGAYNKVN